MSFYQKPQIAIMRNKAGYYLEFLANIQSSLVADNKIRENPKFITAISVKEDMTTREFTKLALATRQGLDYLAQELSFH